MTLMQLELLNYQRLNSGIGLEFVVKYQEALDVITENEAEEVWIGWGALWDCDETLWCSQGKQANRPLSFLLKK